MRRILLIIIAIILIAGGIYFYKHYAVKNAVAKAQKTEKTVNYVENYVRNETGVPLNKIWTVEFYDKINQSSFSNSIVTLEDVKNNKSISVNPQTVDNQIIVQPPPNGYEEGGVYRLTIAKNVPLANGEQTKNPIVINFKTVRKDMNIVELSKKLIHINQKEVKSSTNNEVIFNKTDVTQKLKKNEVIVLDGKTEKDAHARKIVKVENHATTITATVKDPTFNELFDKVDVYKLYDITSKDIQLADIKGLSIKSEALTTPNPPSSAALSSDVQKQTPDYSVTKKQLKDYFSVGKSNDGFSLNLKDVKLEDNGKHGNITTSGDITFHQMQTHTDYQKGLNALNAFDFNVSEKVTENLKATAEYYLDEKTFQNKKDGLSNLNTEQFESKLKITKEPIVIPINGALSAKGDLYLYFHWNIEGKITAEVKFEQNALAGVKKAGGDFSPYFQFDNKGDATFDGKAKAGVEPGVGLTLTLEALKVVGAGIDSRFAAYADGGALSHITHQYNTEQPASGNSTSVKQETKDENVACYKLDGGLLNRNKFTINLLDYFELFDKDFPVQRAELLNINTCDKFKNLTESPDKINAKPGDKITISPVAHYYDYFEAKSSDLSLSDYMKAGDSNIVFKIIRSIGKFFGTNTFMIKVQDSHQASFDENKMQVKIADYPTVRDTFLQVNVNDDNEKALDLIPIHIDISDADLKTNQKIPLSPEEVQKVIRDDFSALTKHMVSKDVNSYKNDLQPYATQSYINNGIQNIVKSDGFCAQCDIRVFPYSISTKVHYKVLDYTPVMMKIHAMNVAISNSIQTIPCRDYDITIIKEGDSWKIDDMKDSLLSAPLTTKDIQNYFGPNSIQKTIQNDVVPDGNNNTEDSWLVDTSALHDDSITKSVTVYPNAAIIEVNENQTTTEVDNPVSPGQLNGKWTRNMLNDVGNLNIQNATPTSFDFDLNVTDNGAAGEINGTATINGKTASFYNDSTFGRCQIDFTLDANNITIKESPECLYWHGASATFDGKYDKGGTNIQTSSTPTSNTGNQSDRQTKAVELVKAYVAKKGTLSSKEIFEYDHMAGKYYIVHAYVDEGDHTATIGWYGVDVDTGKIVDITTEGESILN